MRIFLIKSYKCCIIRNDINEMILLKLIKIKNGWFATIGFLIMESKLKININNFTLITDKNVYYRYIIHKIRTSEATNFSKNVVPDDLEYI